MRASGSLFRRIAGIPDRFFGAGGIAFDYARMAALDTELQSAADQAALAGASQLDGEDQTCERAVAAARNLLANKSERQKARYVIDARYRF